MPKRLLVIAAVFAALSGMRRLKFRGQSFGAKVSLSPELPASPALASPAVASPAVDGLDPTKSSSAQGVALLVAKLPCPASLAAKVTDTALEVFSAAGRHLALALFTGDSQIIQIGLAVPTLHRIDMESNVVLFVIHNRAEQEAAQLFACWATQSIASPDFAERVHSCIALPNQLT